MTITFNGSNELDLSNSYEYYKIFQISKVIKQNNILIHSDEPNDSFTLIGILRHLKSSHSRHVRQIRKLIQHLCVLPYTLK